MALPSGYNRLEYIQSSGTQYIDTGFKPNQDTKVIIDANWITIPSGINTTLFGARKSASEQSYYWMYTTVPSARSGYNASYAYEWSIDPLVRRTVTKDKNTTTVDGSSHSWTYAAFQCAYTMTLFALNNAGTVQWYASARLYSCHVYNNGTLVRNFIPCETPSGEIGLWDDANGVFYANAGTGVFTAGPVANDGRLEYIESSGTQYIDTGFTPNQNTRVIMNTQLTVPPGSGDNPCFFGVSSGATYYRVIKGSSAMALNYEYGTVYSLAWSMTSDTFTKKRVIDANGAICTIDNEKKSYAAQTFQFSYPLYLLAANTDGTAKYFATARIYSCQIYDNGTLVRDYIPYRYNGEVGLWDRVSNTFYGNSGSGIFTAGPEAVYERVEYIQSSGTQYVDTGFVPDANTRVTSMFQMVSPGTANECIFGVVGQFSFRWYGSGGYFRSNGANNVNFATTIPSGARHTVTKTPTTCTIDDVYTVTNTVGTVTSSLYIFAQRGASAPTAYAKVKVFSFRVFDGDALARDFVPVVRSDGTAGLYDQLNEIFYENAGTGTFVAGPIAKYAQVEYLESTGTQYIDALLKPTPNTRVYCAFEMTSAFGSASTGVFGARASAISTSYGLYRTANNTFRSDYYGNIPNITVANDQTKQTVDKNKNVTSFLGGNSATSPVATGTTPYNMLIFSYNNAGNANTYLSSMKLYFMQVYENDVLIRDLVPAVRADGTPGLLDRTNNAFYTNSGTGTFVVGPDLDYAKLEYIQSSGTQYIDTGLLVGAVDATALESVVDKLIIPTGSYALDGTGYGASPYFNSFYVGIDADNKIAYGNGRTDETTSQSYDGSRKVFTYSGEGKISITGLSDILFTFQAPGADLNFLLFAYNQGTNGIKCYSGRIYGAKFYQNGVLIRDYIPTLRENGQIGLIDLVSGLFYANAGSGVFIAGPEIIDPDPPEPPGPYEPPSFTEQTLAYLAALRYPFYKLCRLRFLQPDGSTAFSLDNNPKNKRSGAFIADGSISANLQNGKRRNATVVLSNLDSSFDYNVNTVWFGTEIAIDEGLVLPDGSEYYIQQGVFAIENPTEAVEPANRTATYNLVDKWSYLDGTLFGNLESTYEVPVGTNIFQPIEAILALDRGNGQPVDGVTPIFTEYYNSKTQALPDGSTANLIDSPYTLRIDSDNGTYADVLLGLAAMVNAWIGYDQTGALRIDPSQDDILDTNKPILWQFSMDEATFLGANYTVRNVDVYNDYIVLGELLDDNSQPAGRATNLDPRSDTNVQTIGRKTFRMSAPGFATDKQCQDLAVWKLKRSTSLQKAISISCSQLFHIEENGLVTIVRTDKPGSPVERHLVMGFTRPLTSNGEMQINAVSVQDFVTATVTSWPE